MSNNKFVILYFVFQSFLPGFVLAATFFEDGGVIWEAGTNVFVKYAKQDSSSLGENDHPVDLNANDVSKALGSLKISRGNPDSSDQEQQSVFTAEQIDVLSQNLAKGLAKAKPTQDINFALEKSSKRIFGLKPNRFFVAGRAFYKDEQLNIIIGDYDRPADEGFEAAYDPTHIGIVRYNFDHGRRTKSSKGFQAPVIAIQGVENKELQGSRRNDWLVINLKQASGAVDMRAELQKTEELARKRKELRELLSSEEASPSRPAAAVSATVPATVPATATVPAATTGSFEERLTTLNQLRDKGLISEEEYAIKRKQILDDL